MKTKIHWYCITSFTTVSASINAWLRQTNHKTLAYQSMYIITALEHEVIKLLHYVAWFITNFGSIHNWDGCRCRYCCYWVTIFLLMTIKFERQNHALRFVIIQNIWQGTMKLVLLLAKACTILNGTWDIWANWLGDTTLVVQQCRDTFIVMYVYSTKQNTWSWNINFLPQNHVLSYMRVRIKIAEFRSTFDNKKWNSNLSMSRRFWWYVFTVEGVASPEPRFNHFVVLPLGWTICTTADVNDSTSQSFEIGIIFVSTVHTKWTVTFAQRFFDAASESIFHIV